MNASPCTVRYKALPCLPTQFRPNAQMPVEVHAQIGRLLKSVRAATYCRAGVRNRVEAIRWALDDWVQREHPGLPYAQFLELYSGSGTRCTYQSSITEAERECYANKLA